MLIQLPYSTSSAITRTRWKAIFNAQISDGPHEARARHLAIAVGDLLHHRSAGGGEKARIIAVPDDAHHIEIVERNLDLDFDPDHVCAASASAKVPDVSAPRALVYSNLTHAAPAGWRNRKVTICSGKVTRLNLTENDWPASLSRPRWR